MQIRTTDFNGAGELLSSAYAPEWRSVETVISQMPLHLKASDQAGIVGSAIFDPVGTNAFLKRELTEHGWHDTLPIPPQYSFLGTDVDFGRRGVLLEAQFSNYPFLLNNVLRSELFFKGGVRLADGVSPECVVIITKAHMFPASNSTLYHEQALEQVSELARHRVFDVPMRLLGLFEPVNSEVAAVWTEYGSARYSRTVVNRQIGRCRLRPGRRDGSRCRPEFSA